MINFIYLLLCGLCYTWGCRKNPYFRDAGPLVETTSGSIVGKYKKVFDTNVAEFLGIPYAMPPVGDKRFKKPDPVQTWKGKLFADKMPLPCMQYSSRKYPWLTTVKPSEDCLYLNVWSPTRCCCDSLNKLPVLVWIHGGGFFAGSSNLDVYDGSTIAAFGEVIVVSINYRLGVFGFFYDGSDLAPGSMGMHDQVQALKWIKKNIHSFGGDADNITLFGQSAGAISINLHMVSPLSKGLFHRAIVQSGSAYHPNFVDTAATSNFKNALFASLVNCTEANKTEITLCLKEKDAFHLALTEDKLTSQFPVSFLPVVGSEFLPKHPIDVFDAGKMAAVEVLTGVVSDEAAIFLNYIVPEFFSLNKEPFITKEDVLNISKRLFPIFPENLILNITKPYMENIAENDSLAIVRAIENAFGDYSFNCPVMFQAEKTNAYMYWISHRSLKNKHADWVGVTHFDEVPYVFGEPIINTKNFTPEDGKFSGELLHKWVSFARTGYPLSEDSNYNWPLFALDDVVHELNLRNDNYFVYPRKKACEQMRHLFKSG